MKSIALFVLVVVAFTFTGCACSAEGQVGGKAGASVANPVK